jgi:hypothetical protein
MNEEKRANLEGRRDQSYAEHVWPVQDSGFGPDDYYVSTGIDVKADGPGAAMVSAIEEMGLRDPECYCFHVDHLRTGRKWEVELYPSGEIDVQDWDEEVRDTSKLSS